MKVSVKAALLSALVFPGFGQFYLKRYGRGLAFIIPALIGVGVIVWMAVASVLNRLDSMTAMPTMANLADSASSNTSPYYNVILFLLFCCWVFAAIDAYRIGKEKERQG